MMDKKRSAGVIILVIFDVVVGLLQMYFFIALQGAIFYALLGWLYIFSASGFLNLGSKRRKIFLFSAIPLSILASLHIIALSSTKMPDYYYTQINKGLGIIGITILLPLLINFYFLTRSKVKEQFE